MREKKTRALGHSAFIRVIGLLALIVLIMFPGRAVPQDDAQTDRSPHKSGFVTANGVRLHYLDWGGRGEELLFLPGIANSAHIFDDIAPKFTDRFRVLALTRRGVGESYKPAGGYDRPTLVRDIRAFLDALQIGRVNLAGHSLAGDELRRQGFWGVRVAPVTADARARLKLPHDQGVIVEQVTEGSTLREVGVQPGDVILKVGDTIIRSVDQFMSLTAAYRTGDHAEVTLSRKGVELTKAFALKPRPIESNPDFDIIYSSVTVGGSKRRVIVSKPKSTGRHPAVLFIGGLGCYSVDGLLDNLTPASAATWRRNSYGRILYALTARGFVTMRVEKSGEGDSEGPPCLSPQADLWDEVAGYVAGLKALKSYNFVDGGKVFIFGHSVGSVTGPLVAGEVQVRGLIIAEGIGRWFIDYNLDNARRQLVLRGVPYDEVEREVRLDERCTRRVLVEKQTPEEVLRADPRCADYVRFTQASYAYMQQWADVNPAEKWKAIKAPALVIYGASDFLTSAEEGRYLTDLINSFHPGAATFVLIEGMDHGLTRAVSQRESMKRRANGQPAEFDEEILESITRWLDEVLKHED